MLEAVNDITDRVKDYKTIKMEYSSADYYTILLNGALMKIDVKLPLQKGRNIITVPDKGLKSNLIISVELE